MSAMKVNDPSITSGSASYGVGKAQGAGRAAELARLKGPVEESALRSDRVEISSTASLLQADAAMRAEKVEHLKDLVQTGRYRVDPLALSRRIIEAEMRVKGQPPVE
jgi:flagellar biosynthesis anti-sigma factor FlgM